MIEYVTSLSKREMDYLTECFPEREQDWFRDRVKVDQDFVRKLKIKIEEVDYVSETISYLIIGDRVNKDRVRELKENIEKFSTDERELPLTTGMQRVFWKGHDKIANIESHNPEVTIEFYNGYEKEFNTQIY